MRKNSGFTAYELAVTIAIIAVVAATTLPPYLKWWRASRLQSAVSNIAVDIEMAKTRAVRENALVVIEFDPGGYAIFVDSNDDWSAIGEHVLLNRFLPGSVRIDTASLSFPTENNKLGFNGRGIPADIVSPETINISQAGNDRQISINRLGNVNVQ